MISDRLPPLVPQSAMAELLEILRTGLRRRVRIVKAALEARPLHRNLPAAVDFEGRLDTDNVEQSWQNVGYVRELVAQRAACWDAFRPGDDERIPDAPAVRVLFVAPQRRVGG